MAMRLSTALLLVSQTVLSAQAVTHSRVAEAVCGLNVHCYTLIHVVVQRWLAEHNVQVKSGVSRKCWLISASACH